jgi:hypothetical protein
MAVDSITSAGASREKYNGVVGSYQQTGDEQSLNKLGMPAGNY